MGSDEMIRHIEKCDYCIEVDEVIEFLEKELKKEVVKEVIEKLHDKQADCYNNSLGGYEDEE